MLKRDPLAPTLANRVRSGALTASSEVVRWGWARVRSLGAIGPRSRVARRFGSFGDGSIICFPLDALVNEQAIHIGVGTMINTGVTLSAGWMPDQPDLPDRVVSIGDRCLIGGGSSVIGHLSIEIGDDVWTGRNVHITDMNHDYTDIHLPISRQNQPEDPVVIGAGSWLGHGVVVLPGAHIGRHVVIGAGSVVRGEIPDYSVAVGVPARVVRRHDPVQGWVAVDPLAVIDSLDDIDALGDIVTS
jgi:acetyltransferase-like isoleucine patch superfamily enzyme